MRISQRNSRLGLLVWMALAYSTGLCAEDFKANGLIESQDGGFALPDGSFQATAALGSTPIAVSGEWTAAGLSIPQMIVHDLIFYVDSDTSPPCSFSMNFVIDQFTSRTIGRWDLAVTESVELHFEAGIDTSNLRFGTIGSGTCVRHWAAMGFAAN